MRVLSHFLPALAAVLVAAVLFCANATAQTVAPVSLAPTPMQRFVDNNGNACSGCKVFTYASGTTTKQAAYTDGTGATPQINPIILNTRGEAPIWLNTALSYKFVLSPSTDTDPPTNAIWTVDKVNLPTGTAVTVNVAPLGNGADDTPNIQKAINTLAVGGLVNFAPGNYCIKTGPLTVSTAGVTLQGQNRQSTTITPCGSNVPIIVMTGQHDKITDLGVWGADLPNTTNDTITLGSGCFECEVVDSLVTRGRYGINAIGPSASTGEVYIRQNKIVGNYGLASIYLLNTGGYIQRNKMDQPYPAGTPLNAPSVSPIPVWQPLTNYTVRSSFVSTGGYILQAMGTGTSGGASAPAVPIYNGTVTDGSVTWGLVSPVIYNGIQIDSGSGGTLTIEASDFSSTYTTDIAMTDQQAAGHPPNYVNIGPNNTFASEQVNGIDLMAGYGVKIFDNFFSNCVVNPCTLITVPLGFGGDLDIHDNTMLGGTTGIFIGGGSRHVIANNSIGAMTTGISMGPNVTDFNVLGNHFASSIWGSDITGIFLGFGVDYYTIVGNDFRGNTTDISDASGGTVHHTVVNGPFDFGAAGWFQFGGNIVSALSSCIAGAEGRIQAVTDATSATNGGVVAGGGAHHVVVYCNGTSWIVLGGT